MRKTYVHVKYNKKIKSILCLILSMVFLAGGITGTVLATGETDELQSAEIFESEDDQVSEEGLGENSESMILESMDETKGTEVATESVSDDIKSIVEESERKSVEESEEETEEKSGEEPWKEPEETTEEETKKISEKTLVDQLISPFGEPTGSPYDAPSYGQISLVKFSAVANGCMGGMALDSTGRLWTWGYNLYGELGIGRTVAQQNYYGGMKRLSTLAGIKIVEIGASYETRYALSDDGKVYAWGDGGSGAMGNGTSTRANITPKQVPGLPTIKHIFVSDSYLGNASVFALATDGTLWAWGSNSSGLLGLGNMTTRTSPVQVPLNVEFTDGTRKVIKVACGENSAHLLDDQGDLWTSGTDAEGEQGNGPGINANLYFTKMNRDLTGMGKVIDVDAGYSRKNGSHDRVVAADENGIAWEWGHTYGDGGTNETVVIKQTPQKIVLDASEVAAIGYTPLAQTVSASEMTGFFIDQHGRPWGWGSGFYYGFGTDGPYTVQRTREKISSTAAKQVPAYIGDGDTERYTTDGKYPIYLGGTRYPGDQDGGAQYLGYGFNPTHPTIYDEKYMLKDAAGVVLDTEGNQIKMATDTTMNWVGNLTEGKYYRIDSNGNISSPLDTTGKPIKRATATTMDGVSGLVINRWYQTDSDGKIISPAVQGTPVGIEAKPALDPIEALWINLAFQATPYIKQLDISLSAYAFLDADGNFYKWGFDGSGAVAWGWDYESKYDVSGSLTTGLYDRYTYEVMYMRGAPTAEHVGLSAKISGKVYKEQDGTVENNADITVHVPRTTISEELEADIRSDVSELKYIFIPYDEDNPNFNVDVNALNYGEFMAIYNAASIKGDLINSPISSGSSVQDVEFQVNAPENGRIIVFGVNNRYVLNGDGSREYENINTFATAVLVDNVYTKTLITHIGMGQQDVKLYAATTDNVVKINDDSKDTRKAFDKSLYGLPLDVNGDVIGTTKDAEGNVTVVKAPRYGYDQVEIKSYEAVGDIGLPEGIKPYWGFKEYLDAEETKVQLKIVNLELANSSYSIMPEEVYYSHEFLYVKNLDYWTQINGSKIWDDKEDQSSSRPDSITLTLKQYKRDPVTGKKSDYIKDITSKVVSPDGDGVWLFDLGSYMSYEYSYEIVETAIAGYEVEIEYPNLKTEPIGTSEDLTGIKITNTLVAHSFEFTKVDAENEDKTLTSAKFELYSWEGTGTIPEIVEDAAIDNDNGWKLIDTQTSDVNGKVHFAALVGSIFQLVETKAPLGYSRPVGQWRITRNASDEWEILGKGSMLPPAFLKDKKGDLVVTNMKEKYFPFTGFGGITNHLIIGLGVMILTIVFFLFSGKKRINIDQLVFTKKGGEERSS